MGAVLVNGGTEQCLLSVSRGCFQLVSASAHPPLGGDDGGCPDDDDDVQVSLTSVTVSRPTAPPPLDLEAVIAVTQPWSHITS